MGGSAWTFLNLTKKTHMVNQAQFLAGIGESIPVYFDSYLVSEEIRLLLLTKKTIPQNNNGFIPQWEQNYQPKGVSPILGWN